MKDSVTCDRREFTVQSALALLGGVAITISACSGGDSSSPSSPTSPSPTPTPSPSPSPQPSDATGTVSANHGHTAVITSAALTAANALTLNIEGTAGHPHTVELTAAEVGQIGGGSQVSKNSSTNDAHQHTVTFN